MMTKDSGLRAIRLWRRQWAEQTFPDEGSAREFIGAVRWPHGAACPACGSARVGMGSAGGMRCHRCGRRFDVRTGTVFGGSKLPLRYWLIALRLVVSHPRSLPSTRLATDLGVTQTTAWRMLKRFAAVLGKADTRFSDEEKVLLLERLISQGFVADAPKDGRGR